MKRKYIIFLNGEEGQPQQFFLRATFSKSIFIYKGWIFKKNIGECGSDEIILWLDFLVQIMISFKLLSTVVLSQFLSSWENSVDVITDV